MPRRVRPLDTDRLLVLALSEGERVDGIDVHAYKFRVENRTESTVERPVLRSEVATSRGRNVEVEPLADLDTVPAGAAAEGWVVFFVEPGEQPLSLTFLDAFDVWWEWELDPDRVVTSG